MIRALARGLAATAADKLLNGVAMLGVIVVSPLLIVKVALEDYSEPGVNNIVRPSIDRWRRNHKTELRAHADDVIAMRRK